MIIDENNQVTNTQIYTFTSDILTDKDNDKIKLLVSGLTELGDKKCLITNKKNNSFIIQVFRTELSIADKGQHLIKVEYQDDKSSTKWEKFEIALNIKVKTQDEIEQEQKEQEEAQRKEE